MFLTGPAGRDEQLCLGEMGPYVPAVKYFLAKRDGHLQREIYLVGKIWRFPAVSGSLAGDRKEF